MTRFQLIFFFLYTGVLFSCSKNSTGPSLHLPGTPNIYAAGFQDSLGIVILRYWKNGIPITLPTKARPNDPINLTVTGIVVSGGDVYISGNDFYQLTHHTMATYWKNGLPGTVGDGSVDTYANAIAVSGNDVYLAGYEIRKNSPADTIFTHAVYWKNGIRVMLGDSTTFSEAKSIAVSGNDIYVAGREGTLNNPKAAFWKNGQKMIFADTVTFQVDMTALSSGTGVNPAWVERNSSGVLLQYWGQGMSVPLQETADNYLINSMALSGSDIYAAGYNFASIVYGYFKAIYWKNGNLIQLTDGTKYASAFCIALSGNDVYVGGQQATSAVIWKNGTPFVFKDGFSISAVCVSDE